MRKDALALGVLLGSIFLESAMPLAASSPTLWFSYAAYPSARQLCHEHVMGHGGPRRMEIEWILFASPDTPEKVIAFYEADQKTKAKRDGRGGYDIPTRAGDRDSMTIIPAAKASGYPHCAAKAAANEPTVILVSRAVGG